MCGAPGGNPAQASESTVRRGALPMKIDVTRLWNYTYAQIARFQYLPEKKINNLLIRSEKMSSPEKGKISQSIDIIR
jgi:hypothetical protein